MKKGKYDTLRRQLGDVLVARNRIDWKPYLDPQDTIFFTLRAQFHRPTAAFYRVNAKKNLTSMD